MSTNRTLKERIVAAWRVLTDQRGDRTHGAIAWFAGECFVSRSAVHRWISQGYLSPRWENYLRLLERDASRALIKEAEALVAHHD